MVRHLEYHTEGSSFSLLKKVEEPGGLSRYFIYDEYARLSGIEADTEAGRQTLKSVRYYVEPNLPLGARTIMHTGGDDPDHETAVFTDGLGREIYTVRTALTGSRSYVRSGLIVYDSMGRVVRKSQTRWADSSELSDYTPDTREKHPTLTKYGPSGRVSKVTLPFAVGEDRETSVGYVYNDPWEVVTTHSIGQGSKRLTNGRGHLIQVTDFGGSLEAKVGFCYDIQGNRIKKMDLNGISRDCHLSGSAFTAKDTSGNHIAYWEYDAFGRMRRSNDPDFGVSSYEYNGFGESISQTDGLQRRTTYTYDRIGRRVSRTLPAGEGVVSYVFDRAPGDTELNITHSMGRLVRLEDHTQRKDFSYDQLGRVKSESRTLRNRVLSTVWESAYITHFHYDLLYRIKEIDYPSVSGGSGDLSVEYSYNGFGRVSSIGGEHSVVDSIDYNEFGQMNRINYSNGIDMEYVYDVKGRVQELVYYQDGVRQARSGYVYDVKNNIRSVNTRPEDVSLMNYSSTYSYEYDSLSRLVDAEGDAFTYEDDAFQSKGFKRKYGYALNGNLTGKSFLDKSTGRVQDQWTYRYMNHSAVNVRSSRRGGVLFSMSYDSVGNLLSKEDHNLVGGYRQEMVYDSYNRIQSVSRAQRLVGEYRYDAQGFRVRKRSRRTIFEIDTSLGQANERLITAERWYELEYHNKYFAVERQKNMDGGIIPNTEHSINNVYLEGVRVAAIEPSGAARYFLTDQVDSVKLVADSDGKIVSRTEYYPYGEKWFAERTEDIAPKYNGQELDKESDFYYFNARHYDPELARFVTPDVVVDGEDTTAGWNRYMYVKGNPIKYKDPTGHVALFGEKFQEKFDSDKAFQKEVETFFATSQGQEIFNEVHENKRVTTIELGESEAFADTQFFTGEDNFQKPLERLGKDAGKDFSLAKVTLDKSNLSDTSGSLAHELKHVQDAIQTIGLPEEERKRIVGMDIGGESPIDSFNTEIKYEKERLEKNIQEPLFKQMVNDYVHNKIPPTDLSD